MSSDSALTHTDDSVSYSPGFLQNFLRCYFYLHIRQHVNQYWHFFSVLSFAPSHLLSLNDYDSISHLKSVFVFLPSFILVFPSSKQVIKPRVSERVRRTQTERERERARRTRATIHTTAGFLTTESCHLLRVVCVQASPIQLSGQQSPNGPPSADTQSYTRLCFPYSVCTHR